MRTGVSWLAWMIGTWARSVGAMRDANAKVIATCGHCGETLPVDPAKIAELKGDAYSLVGRRSRCPCGNWRKFHVLHGVMRPLWEDADEARWIELEVRELRRARAKS